MIPAAYQMATGDMNVGSGGKNCPRFLKIHGTDQATLELDKPISRFILKMWRL